jgi:hypothetical protein
MEGTCQPFTISKKWKNLSCARHRKSVWHNFPGAGEITCNFATMKWRHFLVSFVLMHLNSSNHCELEFYVGESTTVTSFSHNTQEVSLENNFQWWFTKGNALGVGHSWNKLLLHKVKWNKGCVALPFTWKSNLRQKKKYKYSSISPCKNIIFEKFSQKKKPKSFKIL